MLLTVALAVQRHQVSGTGDQLLRVANLQSFLSTTSALLLQAMSRLRKNAAYFRVNYLLFVGVVTAVCFCLHPASLFVVAFLAMAWIYLFIVRQAPIVIGGRTFR